MKIGFIGCVEFSAQALNLLIDMQNKGAEICGVVTKSNSVFNSDHVDLNSLCLDHKIPCMYYQNNTADIESFFNEVSPDIIFCFGWSHLLGDTLLTLAPLGIIGFHPASLPQNRGRHPIIWALALGLEKTSSTFFKMDEGADSGPILSQESLVINPEDDAFTLYNKITEVALKQIKSFTESLILGEAEFINQNHELATYWRKRSRKDGLIDWRMQAGDIHNLVRALAKPYPGAEFMYQDTSYIVWKSRVCDLPLSQNIEPGSVVQVSGNQLLIKCSGDSGLWVDEHNCRDDIKIGEYL